MPLLGKKPAAKLPIASLPEFASGEKAGPVSFWADGKAAAPTGVAQRLKALRPQELAFVAAGLGILLLAPVVQYLMSPESASPTGTNFARRDGPIFAGAPDPHEEGLHGIAQGGLVGRGESLITPNSSADPMALIVKGEGPGKADAASPSTEAKEPKKEEAPSSSWKEAISSAKASVKAAVNRAPGLPRPGEKLSSALRGLAALTAGGAGGAAGGLKLDAPSSKGLVNPPRMESSLHPIQSVAGFKGTAARGLSSGPGSTGSGHPSGGSGLTSGGFLLDISPNGPVRTGAGTAMPGGGAASAGEQTMNPSGNQAKDARTQAPPSGENLNQLRAKLEMQKQIDLKYAKLQYDQLDRKKMLEQIAAQTLAQTAQQAFLKVLDKLLNPGGGGQGQGGGGGGGGGQGGGGQGPAAAMPSPGAGGAVGPDGALGVPEGAPQLGSDGVPVTGINSPVTKKGADTHSNVTDKTGPEGTFNDQGQPNDPNNPGK